MSNTPFGIQDGSGDNKSGPWTGPPPPPPTE